MKAIARLLLGTYNKGSTAAIFSPTLAGGRTKDINDENPTLNTGGVWGTEGPGILLRNCTLSKLA